jgi:hypothetical protein
MIPLRVPIIQLSEVTIEASAGDGSTSRIDATESSVEIVFVTIRLESLNVAYTSSRRRAVESSTSNIPSDMNWQQSSERLSSDDRCCPDGCRSRQ